MPKPKANPNQLVITNEFIEIVSKILRAFDGDIKKTRFWMITPNMNFGNVAPLKLIAMSRAHKVIQFIDAMWEESQAPEGFEVTDDGKLQKKVLLREWELKYDGDSADGSLWVSGGPAVKVGEVVKVREVLQ